MFACGSPVLEGARITCLQHWGLVMGQIRWVTCLLCMTATWAS
jgi:hypothetical protein